jgi:flagellar hook-associated protein 2
MAEIKTDILSAVSRSGSGLEIKSLVSSLVTAETSGERSLAERRVDETNTSISAMGQLSQEIGLFKAGMDRAAEAASRTATSSNAAVAIEVTQEALATDFSAAVEVNTLASPQILTFSFGAEVNTSTPFTPGDPITLNTKEAALATLEMGSNDTLNSFVRALNALDGLSASLIDTGSGLSMIVKSREGTANALDTESIKAIHDALGQLGQGDTAKNVTAATDAIFTVDGVVVTRDSNVINDLFPGHRITLNATGTATLNSSETNESVRDRISAFLGEVNALKSYLTAATQRGINGAKPGPLAGDVAAQSILSRVRDITTQPIAGFGAEPVFLAELGVQTERDGTLTLNEDRFNRAIERRPELAEALFATQFSATDDRLSVTGLSFAPPKAGSYSLVYDGTTATLDGQPLTLVSSKDKEPIVWRSSNPDTNGITIMLNKNEPITADVRYGQSLADKLRAYGDSLLGANGLLARREQKLGADLRSFEDQLASIDDKVALLTERYSIQFGRMEAMITSLNKTGEYMKSLMDAWNADR